MSPAWGEIAGSTKVCSGPPPPFQVFTVAKWQAGKKAATKKQSCSHNGCHLVNNHKACVLNSNYVSHQRRHYNAGNLSLHSRSFQCLFSHGRPAFPLSRQRSAALPRLFYSSKAASQQRASRKCLQEGTQHSDCVFAACLKRLRGISFQRWML